MQCCIQTFFEENGFYKHGVCAIHTMKATGVEQQI